MAVLATCLAYFTALKMEGLISFEMSLMGQQRFVTVMWIPRLLLYCDSKAVYADTEIQMVGQEATHFDARSRNYNSNCRI